MSSSSSASKVRFKDQLTPIDAKYMQTHSQFIVKYHRFSVVKQNSKNSSWSHIEFYAHLLLRNSNNNC